MGIYRYLKDVNKQLLQTQVSKNHLSAGTLEMNLKGFPVFFFFGGGGGGLITSTGK